MNKTKATVAICISILLISGAIYFSKQNQSASCPWSEKQSTNWPKVSVPVSASPELEQVFNQVYQQISTQKSGALLHPPYKSNGAEVWLSDDSLSITVPTNLGLRAKICPIDQTGTETVAGHTNPAEVAKLRQMVESIMQKNGFIADNTYSSYLVNIVRDGIPFAKAYKKVNYECTVESSNEAGGDGKEFFLGFDFICFDREQILTAYNQQSPFLRVLNDKERVINPEFINISSDGDRATILISDLPGLGEIAYMYKINGNWKLALIEGNEDHNIRLCSEFQTQNVPQQYWPACEESNRQLINQNNYPPIKWQ